MVVGTPRPTFRMGRAGQSYHPCVWKLFGNHLSKPLRVPFSSPFARIDHQCPCPQYPPAAWLRTPG